MYPSKEWLPWKFQGMVKNFWGDKANQRKYLEWLGNRLGYTSPDDWFESSPILDR